MSSVPASKRGKILMNLERQLKTITKDNGYTTNIYDATTKVKNWQDLSEAQTPTVFIVDETTKYLYHPGRLTERQWNIGLYGIMKNREQTEMEEFIADIETCLVANITLAFQDTGRVCAHMRITNIITDNQLFSEIEGSQLFKVDLEIIYTTQIDQVR